MVSEFMGKQLYFWGLCITRHKRLLLVINEFNHRQKHNQQQFVVLGI